MGREERRRNAVRQTAEAVTVKAVDEGRLIEVGWVAFAAALYPDGMPPMQAQALRHAFYSGAQHLFASISVVLDEGEEPTDADLKKFTLIDSELTAWTDGALGRRPSGPRN